MDDFPGLVSERGQIEEVRLVAAQAHDRFLCVLCKTPCLRNLARTGVLAARRSVDDQYARRRFRVLLPLLGGVNLCPRLQPLDRNRILGVSEALAGRLRSRRLAVNVVSVPRYLEDLFQLGAYLVKGGIVELRKE